MRFLCLYIYFFLLGVRLLIIEVEDLWAFWIVASASIQAHNFSVSGFILVLFFSINSVCVCVCVCVFFYYLIYYNQRWDRPRRVDPAHTYYD